MQLRFGLRSVTTVTVLSLLILVISLFSSTPDGLGPFGITLWFIVLLLGLGGFFSLLLYSLKRNTSRKEPQLLFTSALRQGILISTWGVGLFALAALRQLDIKDIVLVTVLVVLIEFYLRRSSPA